MINCGRLGAIVGMVWYDGGRGAPPGCYCHARSLRAPAPKLVDEGGREEGGGWEEGGEAKQGIPQVNVDY